MITKNELLQNTALMDSLNAYFKKIHFSQNDESAQHKLSTVKKLCTKHRNNFAYSTLRTNFGMKTIFTFEALLRELLEDSAGQCAHHNATIYLALVYLDFSVDLIKASMADEDNNSMPAEAAAHAAVILTLDSQKYLVDPGGYGGFTICPLPIDNSTLPKNFVEYKIIKNAQDTSSFILQRKKAVHVKTSLATAVCCRANPWVNVHFFSTNPIELSEFNASSAYLLSEKSPNYDHLLLSMFYKKTRISLYNNVIILAGAHNSSYRRLVQPSFFYALETIKPLSSELAEISSKAEKLLKGHRLVNGYLTPYLHQKSESEDVFSPFEVTTADGSCQKLQS